MKKRFLTFYIADKPLEQQKYRFQKRRKLAFLQRGYSMVLVKNWKFCKRFVLCKIHQEKVFGDVLARKQAVLDNINMDLKGRQSWHLSKGDSP